APPAKPAANVPLGQPSLPGSLHKSQNYFLWSLERVAMAYGLETIGNRDWYAHGAELLLTTQSPNGCWTNSLTGPTAETAFALLFLRRANLAPDLSFHLKGRV